jgi:phospholipid/cholesterol/gamma-HCH transport system ATP-binding protein
MSNVIEVKKLSKTFVQNKVLDNIGLEVKKGESFVIIGGSGSGKSVLLKNIIGLMLPDKGSMVRINGEDFTHKPIAKRKNLIKKFGMLFQGGALFDSLPIWHNIAFGLLQAQEITPNEARNLAIEKLGQVGLKPHVADLYPAELSGGMQKRAALARAIAGNPEIIFFDEPTSGLDPIMSGIISDLINEVSKDIGATTITITHDMQAAMRIADRIAFLYNGKFRWTGRSLYNSGNPYVDQFVNGKSKGPIPV